MNIFIFYFLNIFQFIYIFFSYFTNIGPSLAKAIHNQLHQDTNMLKHINPNSFFLNPATPEEILTDQKHWVYINYTINKTNNNNVNNNK